MAADLQFKLVISKNAPHGTEMRGVLLFTQFPLLERKEPCLEYMILTFVSVALLLAVIAFYQGATTASGATGYSQTFDSSLESTWKNRHFE